MALEPALPYAAILVVTIIAGGSVATFRPPGPRWRSALRHFAGGVVFAVVAVELLPNLRKQHDPWEMAVSFDRRPTPPVPLVQIIEQY